MLPSEWVHIEYYVFIINAILSFFRLPIVFLWRSSCSHLMANICSFVCLFVLFAGCFDWWYDNNIPGCGIWEWELDSTPKYPAICVQFVGGSYFCWRSFSHWRCRWCQSVLLKQKLNFGSRQALSHYSKSCQKTIKKDKFKIYREYHTNSWDGSSTFGDTFWHLSKVHPTAKQTGNVWPNSNEILGKYLSTASKHFLMA